MKIRLNHNQCCFRLSRLEVEQVRQGETVALTLHLPTNEGSQNKIEYLVSMNEAIQKIEFRYVDFTLHLTASPAILDQLLENPSKEGVRECYETQEGITSFLLQVDLSG